MSDHLDYSNLSKRERQIVDIIHRLGEASVNDVLDQLPDAPSYNAVRVTMYLLANKKILAYRKEGAKHIYYPTRQVSDTKQHILDQVVRNYFAGSTPKLISTLLQMKQKKLSKQDLEELEKMINDAKKNA